MKKFICLLFICLPVAGTGKAQYPAPVNFEMSIRYISSGQQGVCKDLLIEGPVYCTTFHWEAPDTSNIEAQLTGYNVYYYNSSHTEYQEGDEIPFSEGRIIIQTADTDWQDDLGITGVTWVTAVYSHPEGESEPSNIQINRDLPIGIRELKAPDFSLVL